jgi:hypothetical protein
MRDEQKTRRLLFEIERKGTDEALHTAIIDL